MSNLDSNLDEANAAFWDELCGTGLAQSLGIKDRSVESLKKFDSAYLRYYPYLFKYVPLQKMAGRDVLEIGLGYGTLSQQIAQAGAHYNGLDIAKEPVAMVNERLEHLGLPPTARQGNMLSCPFPTESMDFVVSIGCFHHTGNTQRCIEETFRVLRPNGIACVMVYNRYSYRQWQQWPKETALSLFSRAPKATEAQRAAYDASLDGKAAPETEFFSRAQIRKMFSQYRNVRIRTENSDNIVRNGSVFIPRSALLPIFARILGLDLYINARK
ncbi:MAG: class I SAM-dependent methyltransferase [Rhizomicrobium sp.]